MKRARIITKGEVQRVGYRDEVQRLASSRIIKRTTCGSSRKAKINQAIEQFFEQVQITKLPIKVERLEVWFEGFLGEFAYFEIKRADSSDELGERLDFAGGLLARSVALGEEPLVIGRQGKCCRSKSRIP
jgi:hypothetical protein